MDLYEAMGSQRAVRRLKADPISDAVLARVLTAASWAPTGGNVQPFRMITVQDRQRLSVLQGLYAQEWATYTPERCATKAQHSPSRDRRCCAQAIIWLRTWVKCR